MKNWMISGEGEKWSVQLDVRDLGGHLDSTKRQRASTLAGRVVIVLSRVIAICAVPLDFQEKLRILRTLCMHAAFGCSQQSYQT